MAEDNFWFPLHYHKLMHATAGWKDDQFGAYLRLLIYQFDKGYIPSDLDELETISSSIRKNWKIISKKFKDDGTGRLMNPVMTKIREDILNKKEINKTNGAKGGKAKAKKYQGSTENVAGLEQGSTEVVANKIEYNKTNKSKEEVPLPLSTIEECLQISLRDDRWVKANKTTKDELLEFNRLLEMRGHYEKVPIDYKSHFANWKLTGKKELPPEVNQVSIDVEKMREDRAKRILGA